MGADKLQLPASMGPNWYLRSTCAIAVMAKASIAGSTKTRLVPPLTEEEAATLNTVFLRDAADNILAAAAFANISGWMAYAPTGSQPFFRAHLPDSIGLLETVAPTLGECLFHASAMFLEAGHAAVCLINSDSPTLPVGYLIAAATALAAAGDRVVLGPSTDGGYYLIGLKRPHAEVFENIAWSTDQVFVQTRMRATALGLPIVELPTWYDVDDAEALQVLLDELLNGRGFREVGSNPTRANWTRGYISTLVETRDLRARLNGARIRDPGA
jgi:rSAM/selenodomain-associated transferase 1